MARIRILFCIDTVGYDAGTERQLGELIRRIDPARFELHLCCFEDSPQMRALAPHAQLLVLPLTRFYSPRGLLQIHRLRRCINEQQIDLVHTFMNKARIVGVLAARKSACKAVIAAYRNLGYWLSPRLAVLLRWLNRSTTRILANSEGVKRWVSQSEHLDSNKIDVLYNGVDMAKYVPDLGDPAVPRSLGVPDSAKVVGIVANYRPVKDHALFLRAAALVARQVPDAAFLLVGTGPLREELGRLALELGIADKVFFTDGKGRVIDYLARMSVACLSSESEGFSNAILEYMAAGLPVVATSEGGNAEAVEHGVTGFIVPGRQPESFAQPIMELLADDARRSAMGRAGLERCRRLFDIDIAVRCLEEYYEHLLPAIRSATSVREEPL